jgi:SLT domain-containing protein
MLVLADQESAYRTSAINVSDSNAHGAVQVDGGPLHATRGPFQVTADTFAEFHRPSTSNLVCHPVASACTAINHIIATHRVARDASNLAARVGQTNVGVHRGY